jgi:16S rRNA (cytosine967-C5)-methyltransferase
MRVPTHAAINESVNLAKSKASKGSVGFVNAVLRKISLKSREQWLDTVLTGVSGNESLSIKYSHPVWIVQAFKGALQSRGMESSLENLLGSNNLAPKVSLVALPGFCLPEQLSEMPLGPNASPIGVEINGNPGSIEAVQNGLARVQDQGSQLVTLALAGAEIGTDDTIWLDVCAGPGGKAALLAALSLSRGTSLIANEISQHRAQLVSNSLQPLGKFQVTTSDGR